MRVYTYPYIYVYTEERGGKRRWSWTDIQNRKRSASFVLFSRRSRDREYSRSREIFPAIPARSAATAASSATTAATTAKWQAPLRHYSSPTATGIVPDVFRADCRIGHGGAGVFATALRHAVHT